MAGTIIPADAAMSVGLIRKTWLERATR
ncbi:hypothetical protein SAMN05443582_102885 [Phyllobacterium sp. OV277]|nr:hypothetical protein SAMN05443582_102885 [Phyllobacterium sp. OV277]